MRILFIGDIVGRLGRNTVKSVLPKLISSHKIDFVIANGENAAGGNGITSVIAKELFDTGVNAITMGNHTWDKKEIMQYIDGEHKLLRPANYPIGTPGKGCHVFSVGGKRLAIMNLCGRVFMHTLDCPFRCFNQNYHLLKDKYDYLFVDFHAEATSEKKAFGWYADGKASVVVGTHTHVQTSDERILPKGTAYITDVGMTGPRNSVLGVKSELVIQKFITQLPIKFETATGDVEFSAVIVELADGKAKSIERLYQVITTN